MSSLDLLERALASARSTVREVQTADLDKATPCSEWDVKALTNHMTGVCTIFARAAGGEKVTAYGDPVDLVGSDPSAPYGRAVEAALAAWQTVPMDGSITIPVGELPATVAIQILLVDQLLHAHDLSRALGRELAIDDDLAESALGALKMLMTPERRGPGKPFGEEISISSDASVQDRMLAFSGRQP